MRKAFYDVCEKYLGKDTEKIKVVFPNNTWVFLYFRSFEVMMIYCGGYMTFTIHNDTTSDNMADRLCNWVNQLG